MPPYKYSILGAVGKSEVQNVPVDGQPEVSGLSMSKFSVIGVKTPRRCESICSYDTSCCETNYYREAYKILSAYLKLKPGFFVSTRVHKCESASIMCLHCETTPPITHSGNCE